MDAQPATGARGATAAAGPTCAVWVREAPVPRGRAQDGGVSEEGEAGLAAVAHGHAAGEVCPKLCAVRGVGDDRRWRTRQR